MKGTILDYVGTDAFILLDDDSVITMPLNAFESLMPIGSNISLCKLYNNSTNSNYKPCQNVNKPIDLL